MTSARLVGRATGGFATYLSGIEGARADVPRGTLHAHEELVNTVLNWG